MITRTLGFRLSLVVGLALAAGIAVNVTLSIRQQERLLEESKQGEASILASAIKASLLHSMLRGEEGREALGGVIRDIGTHPEIERVRLYDGSGRIRYSTDPSEIGRRADMSSESCLPCHTGGTSHEFRTEPAAERLFYEMPGKDGDSPRSLGVVNPITVDEHAACVRCHADRTVLGVLDVVVSLGKLDEDLSAHRRTMIGLGVLGALALTAVVALLIHFLVHRPVGALVEGTREVALLKLDHRLPSDRRDELGILAGEFNDMTARLERARAEIREFTDSLEQKVEEKATELEAAQVQILRAEKLASLGRMASGAAHEINNPLAGLISFAESLKRKAASSAVEEEDLETIIGEGMRCARIVRSLLDFAKHGEFSREPTDVHALLDRMLEQVGHDNGWEGIEIVREYDPELPTVLLDGPRAEQAFQNILSNAFAAVGGEGRVRIRTSIDPGEGGDPAWTRVEIEDSGPGIPPEIQGRVFDPFFTTRGPGEGFGLGLSVAHGIVEGHGGSITLDSAPGRGTTVTVTLPLSPPPAL